MSVKRLEIAGKMARRLPRRIRSGKPLMLCERGTPDLEEPSSSIHLTQLKNVSSVAAPR